MAGVEIATPVAAGSSEAVVARAAVAPRDAVPARYRVVAPSTVCATPALLQQYAFKEDLPQDITCERIDVEVLLRWSGAREAVLVDELLTVARVETNRGLQYILAGSLAPVEKSETAANLLGTAGLNNASAMEVRTFGISVVHPRLGLNGYENALGSNHFGGNIVPDQRGR